MGLNIKKKGFSWRRTLAASDVKQRKEDGLPHVLRRGPRQGGVRRESTEARVRKRRLTMLSLQHSSRARETTNYSSTAVVGSPEVCPVAIIEGGGLEYSGWEAKSSTG